MSLQVKRTEEETEKSDTLSYVLKRDVRKTDTHETRAQILIAHSSFLSLSG